ncbi:mandelate racemase/muconate lactonizing enzyme family protein [Paenibacillus sp. NPDC056722]|uniref:mandelate racemase/muconate lactonizing enzyme family protein n=1 Tax=Paenibacillus sp. NPDC056722 TaxID=3345924 RepID=UPI00369EF9DB
MSKTAAHRDHEIVRVEPILADMHAFVEIETASGLVGVGEIGVWAHLEAAATLAEKAGRYLIGQSADRIEYHWQALTRFGSYHGSILMGVVSAIDIALWDLKGQRLGVPVHELLGGALRDRVRVYGQIRGANQEEVIHNVTALKAAGFTGAGHLNPFLDVSSDIPLNATYAKRMSSALEVLSAVREAVGDDLDLGIELHRRLSPGEAISFARSLESVRPLFLEDPIRPDSIEAMAEVQRAIGVPIATGERIYSLYEFQRLLQAGGARYIRPCIGLCGGFTGLRKIAALAEAYDVQIIPHNPFSPVMLNANLHAAAALPNFLILEYPTASYIDHTFSTSLRGTSMVTSVPIFDAGYVTVPVSPGLGTSLAPDLRAKHPPREIPIKLRHHIDGSLVEH